MAENFPVLGLGLGHKAFQLAYSLQGHCVLPHYIMISQDLNFLPQDIQEEAISIFL